MKRLLAIFACVLLLATACGDNKADEDGGADTSDASADDAAATDDAAAPAIDEPFVPADVEGGDDVVGSVDDVTITRNQLIDLSAGSEDVAIMTDTLSQWVILEAVDLALEEAGAAPSQADVDAATAELVGQFDESEPLGAFMIRYGATGRALQAMADAEVPASDPDATPIVMCTSHILVETEEEADTVLARIDAGEDLADLASEVSLDTAEPTGNLGCVGQGSFVDEFEDAVLAAEPNSIIGPVQSQFGYHVISVRSVGPATAENHPADAEEVVALAPTLGDQVRAQEVNTYVNEFVVASLKREVVIDPEFGTFDPDTGAIVPAAS